MPAKAYFSADEIVSRFGISHQTLRYYEATELVLPLYAGSNRLYSEEDAIRIELIAKGKKLGFSLSELRQLIGSVERKIPNAVFEMSRDEIARQIQILERRGNAVDDALSTLKGIFPTRRQ